MCPNVKSPDDSMISVTLRVRLKDDALLAAFLQHVRTFDIAHFNNAQFIIDVNAPDLNRQQAEAIYDNITPLFTHRAFAPKAK